MYFQTTIHAIIPLSGSLGIIQTTITVLPYSMLGEFHKDELYRSKSPVGTKRGLGIDCSLLSSVYFLAQATISIVMSPVIAFFGNYSILVVASTLAFIGCLWISCFVIYPKKNDQN
jgi:hypothetical protein